MTLVLDDPGGAPLDRQLGRPLDVSQFLPCKACGKKGADVRPNFHWARAPGGLWQWAIAEVSVSASTPIDSLIFDSTAPIEIV
jgi:hypothetical protein